MHSDRKNKIFLNYSIYFVGILSRNRPLGYPDTINAVFYKRTFILSGYMKFIINTDDYDAYQNCIPSGDYTPASELKATLTSCPEN